MSPPSPTQKDVADLIRKRYQNLPETDDEKVIEAMEKFIIDSHSQPNAQTVIQEGTKILHRLFGFNLVCIGLLNSSDGLFRYEAIFGHTKEAEQASRQLKYTHQQMLDPKEYPGVRINKYVEVLLKDNKPFKDNELTSYNRPKILTEIRPSADAMLEGDYIDIYIYIANDLIGWIELEGPRDGKMPSRSSMKWLELFAAVIGLALKEYYISEKRMQRRSKT